MNTHLTSRLSLSMTAVAVLAAGCGTKGLVTYPVEGRVVFADGTPLPGGTIEFESLEGQPQVNARGSIESDGTFRLVTPPDREGAVAGAHRVLVQALTPAYDI